MKTWAQRGIVTMVQWYQKVLSFDHGILGRIFPHVRVCRYHPSCSQYMIEAVERFGVVRGVWMGVRRVLRCAPWGSSGDDPVPKE